MSDATGPPPPTIRKKNHLWIYFFVFVIVSGVGVAGFMIWWNNSIQLKPEQLEEADKLWRDKGPKDYHLVYTKKITSDSGEHTDTFKVEVRGGKVQEVRMNGKLLEREKDGEDDPRIYHSMDRLLRDIERFIDLDAKPGARKVFVTASFNGQTGALQRYIRRVMGTSQRVEINATLKAIEK